MWLTISGTYIFAFCGVISVLSSQAFGAKNYKLVSQWYQLGALLVFFITLPAVVAFMYTKDVLMYFGTSDDIASLSQKFAYYSIPGIIANSQFMALRMYFKAQSNVMPATVVCAVMVVFNLVVNIALVYGYGIPNFNGLGYIGSPIATSITRTIQCLIYAIYMFGIKKYHLKPINTWSNFMNSNANFYGTFHCNRVKKYFKIGIPQTISSALEDWFDNILIYYLCLYLCLYRIYIDILIP